MADFALPEGFTGVDRALPRDDRPVLAVRRAAYAGADFEVVTARYQPDYRPLAPWRRLSNDAVTDDGEEVLGWRAAPEWLFAR